MCRMHSKQYIDNACDVTLSVYPHRASLKNMPDHGGNRTYDLWNTIAQTTLRETSQASFSPEYITPTPKNHEYIDKFFVCLHGDKIYNSFVCGNTT